MGIERIEPGTMEWEAFYANHIVRYQFAEKYITGKNITRLLDAACGVGYGAKYLSSVIAESTITAVDRSAHALQIANKKFSNKNLEFLEDDCHTLAAAAQKGPYGCVVSFETLEHLPKPEAFLKACHHNLSGKGLLIISTPNKMVSSPDSLEWEFHEKEYTAAEFYCLLESSGFVNIKIFGQQLNLKGKIKNEIRSDLNRILSNPFVRAGAWIQQKIRGTKQRPALKETTDDFEMVSFENASAADSLGKNGPFVLLAVAEKG